MADITDETIIQEALQADTAVFRSTAHGSSADVERLRGITPDPKDKGGGASSPSPPTICELIESWSEAT